VCMPCRMARVACWSDAGVGAWSKHMKSSTNTSRTLLSLSAFLDVMCGRLCTGGTLRCSSGWGGACPLVGLGTVVRGRGLFRWPYKRTGGIHTIPFVGSPVVLSE